MDPDVTNADWRDGYHNGYIQGIGIVVGFLDHIAEITEGVEGDWTAELADALRRAAANIPSRPPGA